MMQGGLRERIGSLEGREKIGVALIGTLVIAGVAVWYLRSLPSTVHVDEVRAAAGAGRGGAGSDRPIPGPSATPGVILVDVAGRVHHPGVYEFHQGDRVVDAIERAGGALPGSDLTSLNLAALLTDAEQIIVGKAGASGSSSGLSTGDGSSGSTGPGAGEKVNVNTATLDQLVALPGIGPVLAQRIISYREEHGPFRSVRDLLDVPGIGDSHMTDLEPLVTV